MHEQSLDDAINGAGVLLGFTIFGEGILMALLPVLTPLLIVSLTEGLALTCSTY